MNAFTAAVLAQTPHRHTTSTRQAHRTSNLCSKGYVCDKCNAYFAKLESYFTHYHPGADAKLMALGKTKKGKQPKHTTQAGEATRTLGDDGYTVQMPMSDVSWKR